MIFSWLENILRGTIGTDGTDGTERKRMQINGNGNVYEQIIEYYRKFITLGVISKGEKMPSCRELAIKIGVNHKTVERAYNELSKMGLIESIPKKGYFVTNGKTNESIVYDVIRQLKDKGFSKKEIIKTVEEVFGEE